MLLNRSIETDVWQQKIMDDYNVTPLSLLYDHFVDRTLPSLSLARKTL